uniref:Uncharacterized protein n=1 Tax=Opuntia streptacantha TaxID=393608 RepID=A0A7C9ART6_OPUST
MMNRVLCSSLYSLFCLSLFLDLFLSLCFFLLIVSRHFPATPPPLETPSSSHSEPSLAACSCLLPLLPTAACSCPATFQLSWPPPASPPDLHPPSPSYQHHPTVFPCAK